LIVAQLVNPVGAVRTGALLAIQGTTAFGSGALALLRFTRGPLGAAAALTASILAWLVFPLWAATRRVSRADI
jgi:Cu-processing system permease protein